MEKENQLLQKIILQGIISIGQLDAAQKYQAKIQHSVSTRPIQIKNFIDSDDYVSIMNLVGDDLQLQNLIYQHRMTKLINQGKQKQALQLLKQARRINKKLSAQLICSTQLQNQKIQTQHKLYREILRKMCPNQYTHYKILEKLLKKGWANSISDCKFHAKIDCHRPAFTNRECIRPPTNYKKMVQINLQSEVHCLSLNFNQELLAAACKSCKVCIFNVKQNQMQLMSSEQLFSKQQIICLQWFKQKNELLVAVRIGKIKIVDNNLNLLHQIETDSTLISACTFMQGILTSEHSRAITYLSNSGLIRLRLISKTFSYLKVSGNKIIAVSPQQGIISIIDPFQSIQQKQIQDSEITQIQISKNNKFLYYSVSDSTNYQIKMWDFHNIRMMNRFPFQPSKQQVLRLSLGGLDDTLLATGSTKGYVSIWHIMNSKPIIQFQASILMVSQALIDQTATKLFTASDDGYITYWKLQ